MSKISSINRVQKYINKVRKIKARIRELKKQLPANLGKHLMQVTRQPMMNKNGKLVTYKTRDGHKELRHHYIHSWKEFTDKYVILPRYDYDELMKQNGNNDDR